MKTKPPEVSLLTSLCRLAQACVPVSQREDAVSLIEIPAQRRRLFKEKKKKKKKEKKKKKNCNGYW